MVLKVGLTGGIGSGKTAVADRLRHLGAVVIDSDRIAREVVAPGSTGLAEIVAVFGTDVLASDGSLDRTALGARVFGDETARRRLEAITHPRVRARSAELAAAAPPEAIVVNDVPLLVEVGLAPTYHLVVVVHAALETRLARLLRHRGMSRTEARQRIAAQADDAQRQAAADVVLTNDGSLAELHAAIDALWRDRLVPYAENLRHRRVVRASQVQLVEADPTWPQQYERLAARIRHAVAPADPRVDHIGSTAMPGMAAKDVIDIQLTVSSLADADSPLAEQLAAAGFPRFPGQWWDSPRPPGGDPWAKRLHGSADPGRPVHLHVRAAGSPGWRYALLIRDHLRADPERRAAYLRMKRAVAATAEDRASYATAKDPWFVEEHRRAEEWASRTGWRP